jgi:hypothetical protein
MLISKEEVARILQQYGIATKGALHVGAHECEELDFYNYIGLSPSQVIWLDALGDKVHLAKTRGIPNVYEAVVSDKDNETVSFIRTNNGQSSSILPLGTHAEKYPHIHVVDEYKKQTITLDTFFHTNNLDASDCTFWNFDIQGAELKALKGAECILPFANALYLEVNAEELYKGCGLLPELDSFLKERGFQRVLTSMVKEGWGDALYLRING